MARSSQLENQSISSWTGFNIKTRDGVTVIQYNVGYLPSINAPATQMSTVNEVLNQSPGVSQASLKQVLDNSSCTCTMKLFGVYIEFLRGGNGNLSTFWLSYMDMVEILLRLIRASRDGDWMLHLTSVRAMIPWCFDLNYARYLAYYYAQMSQLPTTHPDVNAEFMQGGFSVHLGSNNPFGRIPVDQTIEETLNKDTQTPGVTKVFSLKPGSVSKHYLRALEIGEEAYQTFKQTRLDDDPPSVKFHDKMTKQRLKTFSTISTKTSRKKGKIVVLKADRNLFIQMILVAESRSVNMKDVLAHPLRPLPCALANEDSRVNKHLRLDKIAIKGFSPEISSFVPFLPTVENPHKSLHGKCPIFTKIQNGGQPT